MNCSILLALTAISLLRKSTADCSKNNTTDENDSIEFNAREGHLSSPGYPEFFTDDIQCTWYIHVARRHSIELEFEFFDFGHSEPCSTSQEETYLEVHDGANTDSKLLGMFCGKTQPGKISSSGREMWIRFKTHGYRSVRFKATYRAVKDSPSTLLVVAGVCTIIGLMLTLLLLTLYLKRKRRNSDEENTSLAGSPTQENQQNCGACGTSGTSGESIDLQFSSVAGNTDARKVSLSEQEPVTPTHGKERKRSQSLGTFAQENLTPVVE